MPQERQFTLRLDPACDPENREFEIVERKGIGHPDTLADGIAELCSIKYSEYCLAEFGVILHHNLDKVGVFGGLARFSWTDGHFARPLRVVFGGRASMSFGGRSIPLREILERSAAEQLAVALPGFAMVPVEYIHLTTNSSRIAHWFSPRDVNDLPEIACPKANDTAYLVGNSPRTRCESVGLSIEAELRKSAWWGSDIKVLVVRNQQAFNITVCVPALVGQIRSANEYNEALAAAQQQVRAFASRQLGSDRLDVALNPQAFRLPAAAPATASYVNMSGSAIDYGEDGLVGRGNGRTGLIAPNRMHGNEVLFGKNPTYHVGKVTAYFVDDIAARMAKEGGSVECIMCTRNGWPLNAPSTCVIQSTQPLKREIVEDTMNRVMSSKSWIENLVGGRRYLPRMEGG